MRLVAVLVAFVLAGCAPMGTVSQSSGGAAVSPPAVDSGPLLPAGQTMAHFRIAVTRIEPVAEQICRQRGNNSNCDFLILVDDRPGAPMNAYQTLDRNGRPVIVFTARLIAEARNVDEIAFVLAHEAAHHIEGHLARQQQNAVLGATLIGSLAGALGGNSPDAVQTAQQLGATVGARAYSRNFELEADATGTRIAHAAGFDPLRGSEFFFRIPDPGNRFLGTHPANADRLRVVRAVAATL
ncbi:M48 family metallopeptidase [Yoonia vestfoldensis]|uniref:Beta-barrel assembly-enhancing protease n=1 Tax=Yoonia vestfoldensis TaxID=245188 RepID=A0A1Y0E8F0_9RHOB|nr:M48 family metallopeptidase [Yoonia vestfoldensis]ART99812.1 beta-barrel assembly-enhancing protease [Yoonia vestfoldensis]